jgi:hypothetical protein
MAKKKAAAKKGGKKDSKKQRGAHSPEELAAMKAKADAEAEANKPVELAKLTRSLDEIVQDRVTLLPDNIGIKLSEQTTIEESLAILDWATAMSDHVGFMIGDVLNFGQTKFGQKYTVALNQTGRAISTLWGYAEAARRIPADKRKAALTFTHHREILRLPDEKMDAVLEEVSAQAEKGERPTVQELRFKIQKLTPKKRKKPAKSTSGKHGKKKKDKPEPPPYQPSDEEQSQLDAGEEAIQAAAEAIKASGLFKIVGKLDNKEKKRWLEMVHPIVVFYNAVDEVTGY